MIRYDWEAIRRNKLSVIIKVMRYLAGIDRATAPPEILKIVANLKDRSSFILNIKDVLSDPIATDSDRYFYFELAAYRNYYNYLTTGELSLPTNYIKHKYPLEKLKYNPMLTVTDDKIYFKYERK